jgi:hypothetical protein
MTERTRSEALAEAERVSTTLIAASRELLRWEWDSRFSAALAVVKAPNDRTVLELLASSFVHAWERDSVAGAPAEVRTIAAAWGLNAGQRLFTLDPADDPLLFAAWWPWGNPTTASLRIGCSARGSSDDPLDELRRWFSL